MEEACNEIGGGAIGGEGSFARAETTRASWLAGMERGYAGQCSGNSEWRASWRARGGSSKDAHREVELSVGKTAKVV